MNDEALDEVFERMLVTLERVNSNQYVHAKEEIAANHFFLGFLTHLADCVTITPEIAERMELPVDKVKKVQKISKEPISLETPIGEEEDSSLGDFIEDKKIISPADAVMSVTLSEQTRSVLSTLTPREEKVLRMRFGIGEKSDHTLEEVGQDFFVTRERIRQIEAKALRKLRHPSRAKMLKSYVDKE